ncbi:Arginase/deacetylase [Glonium stellatum]|uniref:Arginase/deacetylase n=1 Tax=Glonium stellatum TaxID=574774 RepID=A0A8E2EWB1_9PEZI|nr:Arginase/deacetylase [Glonium stellatum]
MSEFDIRIYCIPSEAGTHFAGQSKAPDAFLYKAKFGLKLASIGCKVVSTVPKFFPHETAQWVPAEKINGVRNEQNAFNVLKFTHTFLTAPYLIEPRFPIFLGGDCSITPAVFSSFTRWHQGKRAGLLYMDGDADLTLPSQTTAEGSSGILDSMVMSHLTRRKGGLKSMEIFSQPDGSSLVNPENTVLFGFDPLQPATEHWVYLLENGFKAFTRPSVQADPIGCATKALQWLESRVDVIMLHFDVDVIDSGMFPLANYPHYAGLEFEQAMSAINVFLKSRKVMGLVITEVNPNNDPNGWMVEKLVDSLVQSFKNRKNA